ncbi:hypothetical protein OPQ81_007099 [Rhizoctonia solani]|nr:hypothetical protein OPQ81_007099 [Rhizoctonia solani]
MASTDSSSLVPGAYRLRAVSEKDPSSELYATYHGLAEQIKVAEKSKHGQVWDVSLDVDGCINIRALGFIDSIDTYLRNEKDGKVGLGPRQLIRPLKQKETDGRTIYSLTAPASNPNVIDASDWFGTSRGEVVTVSGGLNNPPVFLDSYLWYLQSL